MGKLDNKKLCGRWVAKLLTNVHKQKCLTATQIFLQCYQSEGDESPHCDLDILLINMLRQSCSQCSGSIHHPQGRGILIK